MTGEDQRRFYCNSSCGLENHHQFRRRGLINTCGLRRERTGLAESQSGVEKPGRAANQQNNMRAHFKCEWSNRREHNKGEKMKPSRQRSK